MYVFVHHSQVQLMTCTLMYLGHICASDIVSNISQPEYPRAIRMMMQVAVKSAVAPETSIEALNVLREIECFSSVKHPNVLPFLGACLSDSERCLLVTEYMPGGNLKDWIHGNPGARKPYRKLSERLKMALDVRYNPPSLAVCQQHNITDHHPL
jgi:serine/threonine protein kinase